jgi:hypothetical protein
MASALEFDELRHGQLGIIVTEASRNIATRGQKARPFHS